MIPFTKLEYPLRIANRTYRYALTVICNQCHGPLVVPSDHPHEGVKPAYCPYCGVKWHVINGPGGQEESVSVDPI